MSDRRDNLGDPHPDPFSATGRTKDMVPAAPLFLGDVNLNPEGIGFWDLVREDLRTHDGDLLSQGFWTLFWHRFGNWRMSVKPKLLRAPLSLVYRIMFKTCEWLAGVKLSYNVPVGRRLRIDHFGGMVLGARSIGHDVTVRQNVTLGIASKSDLRAKPVISDHVDIGAGAVIVGDIVIGRGAIIGANAVVTKSVPPYGVVVGVPGRVIRSRDPAEIGDPSALRHDEGGSP
jgi:serine O-acetyltransferase